MTADAAHVAAVLRATAVHQHRGQGQRKWDGTAWMCRCGEWVTDWNRHRATVAAETLTPLIRAQVLSELSAHPVAPYLIDRVRLALVVDRNTGCWVWTGATNEDGYGQVKIAGVARYVHRVVYEMAGRPSVGDLLLDHTCHDPLTCVSGVECRHRRCANPDHLEAVEPKVNSQRGAKASHSTGRCRAGLHDVTDPANLYTSSNGRPTCAACRRIAMATYQSTKRKKATP